MEAPAPTITIRQLENAGNGTLADINSLLAQLSRNRSPVTDEQLTATLQSPANTMYVAIDETDHSIIGMAMLVTVRQITGTKCWIEDVVVADGYRGHGIGKRLMQTAIAGAPEDATSINLTSNPSRKAAHHLYAGLGFQKRDTVVFRLASKSHDA